MVASNPLSCATNYLRSESAKRFCGWPRAKVPVIWATQVLESLAKDGLPSTGV